MIFTRNEKTVDGARKFEVRTLGMNFWIDEAEFRQELEAGHLFFKANKPVTKWAWCDWVIKNQNY